MHSYDVHLHILQTLSHFFALIKCSSCLTAPFQLLLRPLGFPLIWRFSKSTWARFSCPNFLELEIVRQTSERLLLRGLLLAFGLFHPGPDGFASLIGIKLDSFAFMNNWSGPSNLTDNPPPSINFNYIIIISVWRRRVEGFSDQFPGVRVSVTHKCQTANWC